MSFYGLVLILTVLILSFYITAFLNEIGSMWQIEGAYAAVSHQIRIMVGTLSGVD